MAVLKGINGLQVHILSPRDSYKEEYHDTDEEQPENVATQYIEAESGKDFHIRWNFQPVFPFKDNHITTNISLDGKAVDSMILDTKWFKGRGGYQTVLSGARTKKNGKWYELPFSFADLNIDEDNHGLNDTDLKEKVGCLGEISVRFWRVEKTGESDISNRTNSFESLKAVPEKALKGRAVSQQAHLGEGRVIANLSVSNVRYIDPEDKPFAVFNFRYRPRSGLEALGLITALEDRPIESLSNEELRELVKRQQEQLKATSQVKTEVKIKREREDDDGAERNIKRQDRSRTSEEVETLDLTEV